MQLVAAPANTANWTNTNVGTSVTNAADWFTDSNWDSPSAPDGGDWNAIVLRNATGSRFIKIDRPMAIGAITTLVFSDGSANSVNFVSDSGVTLAQGNDSSRYYTLTGGRWFSDWSSSGDKCGVGVLNNMEFNGRIVTPRFTLAGGYSCFRLDHFATSSSPLRTDDVQLNLIYRGSGHLCVVGARKGVAHDGTWHVTAGSPYVFRTEATPVIAPGAIVTCGDVFPAGTFVKRVFSDTCIELSAAASDVTETGEKTLSFAAIVPVTRMTIPVFAMATYVSNFTSFSMPDQDGDFRVEVNSLVSYGALSNGHGPYRFCPHTVLGNNPATIVIHDAAGGGTGYHANVYAQALLVELGTCHLEFAETGRTGAKPGFPDSTATTFNNKDYVNASSVTRLTVTNGISAAIGQFTNFHHVVVKDGAGSLSIGFTNNVARNTGKLVVEEGTLELPEGSWVKTVAVSNGATLRINGTFTPTVFIAEPGAIVAGDGVLSVSMATPLDGVRFTDGAAVQLPGMPAPRLSAPATNVPDNVAFWVDASRTDRMTFASGSETDITRVDDVRGAEYGFATNTLGGYPTLQKDHRGNPHHIFFNTTSKSSKSQSPDDCIALIWNKRYTNIRAVFQVLETADGGGQFLGSNGSSNHFMRPAEYGYLYNKPIFYSGTCASVLAGPFYVNGLPYDSSLGYPYKGDSTTRRLEDGTQAKWWTPAVYSAHPISDTAANAFAFNSYAINRSGYHRLCECLIFTNEVTETERLAITGYLMKKWLNHDISFERFDTDNPFPVLDTTVVGGIAVAEGDSLYVGQMAGGNSFAKRGSGTLSVDDYADAQGSLIVSEGTLEVNSVVPSPSLIPEGAYVHFDASDMSTITTSATGRVTNWQDVRGSEYFAATAVYSPTCDWTRVAYTPRGMTAIDFGPFKGRNDGASWVDKYNSPELYYPPCSDLHTVFMVMDTSQGGGVLVGVGYSPSTLRGPNEGYGILRLETLGEGMQPYSAPIITNAYTTCQKNMITYPAVLRTNLNGQRINPLTTGFSGGWDLVSLVSCEAFGGGSFASHHWNTYVGGQKIGEAILYREGLSSNAVAGVEAYLRWKWFGETTPGYRPAVASNLTVAAGATLNISGGAPMTVKGTFSGGGTVTGALALAADAVIEVPVAPNDTIQPVTISGTVDLSNGGTVRLVGDARRLRGDYTLVSCPSLTAASTGTWTIEFDGARDPVCKYIVFATDGAFVLRVMPPGTTIIFR
jgi:hypothetical protein